MMMKPQDSLSRGRPTLFNVSILPGGAVGHAHARVVGNTECCVVAIMDVIMKLHFRGVLFKIPHNYRFPISNVISLRVTSRILRTNDGAVIWTTTWVHLDVLVIMRVPCALLNGLVLSPFLPFFFHSTG